MPNFKLVTRIHVLSAIREHDQLGAEEFRKKYGFGPGQQYLVRERGKLYDAKAILGVAHRYATGTVAESDEFSGGLEGAVKTLDGLEFTIVSVDEPKPARKRASTTRSSKPKAPARQAKPEPVVEICPNCFMQLPTTGVCDNCA